MTALILDTETTGTKEPVPVEVAWITLDALDDLTGPYTGTLEATFHQCLNPGVEITCGAMATHHITHEDVADCPPAQGFRVPDDVQYLIGHNVDFDYQALCNCGPQPAVKRICTLALSRALWPEADSHGLGAMVYRVNPGAARILCPHAHSASADVELVSVLLREILALMPCVTTFEALYLASEDARLPTVMPYGKHKGVPIAQVPMDYRAWLLKQPDVDEYLRAALAAKTNKEVV